MALFQQSSLTFAQAKVKIARAASSEADPDMLTKAGDALEAAFQSWNNRRHWNFLRDSHVFNTAAPLTITNCTTTAGSTTVTNTSFITIASGAEGFVVAGSGISPETVVVSVDTVPSPDQLIISAPASISASGVTLLFYQRDYATPTNYKYIYDIRNTLTNRVVWHVSSRDLGHLVPNQEAVGEPFVYDLHPVGEEGKIRFYPIPNASYPLNAKYFRRLTVPSTDGTALDLPIDLEWGLLAEAKSIFLSEKGGYDSTAAFWASKAQEVFRAAVLMDSKIPDDSAGFMPDYVSAIPSVNWDRDWWYPI
jgi:hypothetical protein